MIDPDLRIPPPRLHRLRPGHLQIVILHQMRQNLPDDIASHELAHTLPRAKAKPPKVVPRLRGAARHEPLRPVLVAAVPPVRIADVERVRVDDEVGARGEVVAADGAGGRDGLGHGEGGQRAQAGGFLDAGGQEGRVGEEVGVEVAGDGGGAGVGDLLAQLGGDGAVGGEEDDVPADAADGDVEVGVEHLVEGVQELGGGELAGVAGGEEVDDGGVVVALVERAAEGPLVEG